MSKPKWQDAWAEAFEEGFDEEKAERLTHPMEKKAVAVRRNEDGTTEIVKTGTGAEAMKMIAEAEAAGLSVEQNAGQVENLMNEQNGATDVPPEIYQLMSSVIEFAQELSSEWKNRHNESLVDEVPQLATEIEYTMDDVENQ